MVDYAMMGGILLFLLSLLVVGAKYIPSGNPSFFDQQNSRAMRGFWCLIVVLVHTPQAYQNPIQDLLGSFAYIGVTFFFMTSAYGLSLSAQKRSRIGAFWMKRLPKLFVPNWITNIMFALILFLLCKKEQSIMDCLEINPWVQWLLGCYIAFWLGYLVNQNQKSRMAIVITLVMLLSGCVYYLKYRGMITTTTWCSESMGFIWGIVLFSQYGKIKSFFHKRWFVKAVLFWGCSLLLGILYLLFKNTAFWGDYLLKILLGLSILCFILILNTRMTLGNKISYFLGDISFEVYLAHGAVFQVLSYLFPNLGSGLFILLSLAVSIVSAIIIHKVSKIVLHCCGLSMR